MQSTRPSEARGQCRLAVALAASVAVAMLVLLLSACGAGGGSRVSLRPTPTRSAGPRPRPTQPRSPSPAEEPSASPKPTHTVDPGTLPQTMKVPSATTAVFRARMAALWRGIVDDSVAGARTAFFPLAAYLQVKDVSDPGADFRARLVSAFAADLHAAHRLLGSGAEAARLVGVFVPGQWAWIPPGGCFNKIGYWHAPGSRLVYREGGTERSFGVFSLISWRGEWYVVHLSSYDAPGTVDDPSTGRGSFGPPGGC